MDRKGVVAMTFDLEWAKDPASGGITGSWEACQLWGAPGGGMSRKVATHQKGPGYYHVTNRGWWLLMDAMETTGMVSNSKGLGIPFRKMSDNGGSHVLPREIASALQVYRERNWRIDGSFEEDEDPESCRRLWRDWVVWLEASADHGGFRVF